jgi:hypothetical protein
LVAIILRDRRIGCVLVGAFFVFAGPNLCKADEALSPEQIRLVDPSQFSEKFSGNTQVSGQLLSGLSYGSSDAVLDPSSIYLAGASGRVCVRLTTEDGRYWASNLFEKAGPSPQTLRLAFPTAYAAQLRSYRASEMMVLAARSDDCSAFDGQALLPGIVGDLSDATGLMAYVNASQGRIQAQLQRDGEAITTAVRCEMPADGARVTYSAVCNLPLPSELTAGEYDLSISVRSLTGGGISENYRVFLD